MDFMEAKVETTITVRLGPDAAANQTPPPPKAPAGGANVLRFRKPVVAVAFRVAA